MTAFIDQYRKHLQELALYADKTILKYVASVVAFNDFATHSLKCSFLDTRAVHMYQWLASVRKTGISDSQLKNHLIALKGFFTFLFQSHRIDHNPAAAILPFRVKQNNRVQPISADHAARLLRVIDQQTWVGKRNFVMLSCLWALGLRCSEVTSLKVGSFKRGGTQGQRTGLLRVSGKGKKERALFVVDALYDVLTTYLARPETPSHKSAPLFPIVTRKKALSNDQLQKIVKNYARQAGIKQRVTPHVLRHSFATEMYRHHVPLEDIRVMMGHDNRAETAIYIHVSDQAKKEALHHIAIEGAVTGPKGLSWLWWWKRNKYPGFDTNTDHRQENDTRQ